MNKLSKALLLGTSALVLGSEFAHAQEKPWITPSQERTFLDANGVDLLSGREHSSRHWISIGSAGEGLSAHVMSGRTLESGSGYVDQINHWAPIEEIDGITKLSIGSYVKQFTLNSQGNYQPIEPDGSSLILDGQTLKFTSSLGVVFEFDTSIYSTVPGRETIAMLAKSTTPQGVITEYVYKTQSPSGNPNATEVILHSVKNNHGYQLKFSNDGKDVTAVNNRIDFCAPEAESCSFTEVWAAASYEPRNDSSSENSSGTITNSAGDITTFNANTITNPDNSSVEFVLETVAPYRVKQVKRSGGIWNYDYSENESTRELTVTISPPGTTASRTVVSDMDTKLIKSSTDELGRKTEFEYDAFNRLEKVTYPHGNSIVYEYDARGNIKKTTQKPSSGSNLADIVTEAFYPANCDNPVICNKPEWVKDAAGNITNFEYDPVHGGITKVLAPAPDAQSNRPTTRFEYVNVRTNALDENGNTIQLAPITKLKKVLSCIDGGETCIGTEDDSVLRFTYRPNYNGSLNITEITNGDGSKKITTGQVIDIYGNTVRIDGALPGSHDRQFYVFDGPTQRLTGVIGEDPDGSGPKKRRANRITFDGGRISKVEQGVSDLPLDITDPALNNFSPIQSVEYGYDSYGRRDRVVQKTGSSIQRVMQMSYTTRNQLECQTLRMNPVAYSVLPSNACSAGPEGEFGPDRIVKNTYFSSGQLKSVTRAFGTDDAATEKLFYRPTGSLRYLDDANGNRTFFGVDGFSRPIRTTFPGETPGTINGSDRITQSYDAYGRPKTKSLRSGENLTTHYDNLGRVKHIDAPGTADDITYGYDHLNNLVSVSRNGETVSLEVDALGLLKSEETDIGKVSYDYDSAGRMNKMTYPTENGQSYFINYDRDQTGAISKIRENNANSGLGVLASYVYDDLGRRDLVTMGNGVSKDYVYDSASNLAELIISGTDKDLTISYDHNPAGQITGREFSNPEYVLSANDLVDQNFSINHLNQAEGLNSEPVTYDSMGNVDTIGSGAGTKSHAYDVFNNLTGVNGPDADASLDYDALNRLHSVQDNVASNGSAFLYSGANAVSEYDESGSTLKSQFVMGPSADERVLWKDQSGANSVRQWPVSDHLGSVIGLTNDQGTLSAINKFGDYGEQGSDNSGRFQYTGQMWVPETNLYHYKSRALDPDLKRFLQPDSIGYQDGMNLYRYVGGDPLNAIDPTGSSCFYDTIYSGATSTGGVGSVGTGVAGTYTVIGSRDCYNQQEQFDDRQDEYPDDLGLPFNNPGKPPTAPVCLVLTDWMNVDINLTNLETPNGLFYVRPDLQIGRGVNDPFRDRLGWKDVTFDASITGDIKCVRCNGRSYSVDYSGSFSDIPYSIEVTEPSLGVMLNPWQGARITWTDRAQKALGLSLNIKNAILDGEAIADVSKDAICRANAPY